MKLHPLDSPKVDEIVRRAKGKTWQHPEDLEDWCQGEASQMAANGDHAITLAEAALERIALLGS